MVGTSRVEVHHAMISPLPETEVTLERQEVDGAGRAGRGCQGELWFAPFFLLFLYHRLPSLLPGSCAVRLFLPPPNFPLSQHSVTLAPCPVGQESLSYSVGQIMGQSPLVSMRKSLGKSLLLVNLQGFLLVSLPAGPAPSCHRSRGTCWNREGAR